MCKHARADLLFENNINVNTVFKVLPQNEIHGGVASQCRHVERGVLMGNCAKRAETPSC